MIFHKDGTLPASGQIFVFGSNLAGRHGAGSALIAKEKFGAKYGIGKGLTGQSYAIPTKDFNIKTIPLDLIKPGIIDFLRFASTTDKQFFVTRIGCGLAGYQDYQIAPLFKEADDIQYDLSNCSFSEEWISFLE